MTVLRRSADTPVALGLVGCGAAAVSLYVPALKRRPWLCKSLYLVDKDRSRACQLADELGAVHYTDNYQEILDKVQGVIIGVPHFLHYRIGMDCLKKGVHVLCEKPLAETRTQVRAMIDEAERRRVAICVNNTRRMFETSRYVKQAIASGEIGRLRSIKILEAAKFNWESATDFYVNPKLSAKGVMIDLGAHVLDLVCWWVGSKPELVRYQDDSFGGPEGIGYLHARRDGCEIEVKLNRLIDAEPLYSIAGEQGAIGFDPSNWKALRITSRDGRVQRRKLKSKVRSYQEFVGQIIDNLVGVIAGNEAPMVSAGDVIDSIELIDECYRRRERSAISWYEGMEALLA